MTRTPNWTSLSDVASEEIIDSRDMEAMIDELEGIEQAHKDWTEEPEGDEPEDLDEDQVKLLDGLREVRDACGREWTYGVPYVRESYWERYCEQYADDVGLIESPDENPLWSCIDWAKWAEMMAQDYSTIEIGDTTFYYRD